VQGLSEGSRALSPHHVLSPSWHGPGFARDAFRARMHGEEPENGYECLICGESVRRQPAMQCAQCSCKPWHKSCGSGLQTCPQCAQPILKPFKAPLTLGAPGGPCVDLTCAAPAQTGGAQKQPVVVVDSDEEESAEGLQKGEGKAGRRAVRSARKKSADPVSSRADAEVIIL